MNSKVLVVGFACLSAMAMAQSSAKSTAPATDSQQQVSSPRDVATGQSTGKRMHKPITVTAEVGVQDQASGKVSGKTAADDWQAPTAKSASAQGSTRVATGDVNGDGKADLKQTKSSGTTTPKSAVLNSGSSSVKSPRDLATGQASGK